MKKWIILLTVIGGGLGVQKYDLLKSLQNRSTTEENSRKSTATVELRDISFFLTAAGDIGPAEQVSVRPEINGRIELLPVDVGDRVKKSDVLFTLDDKDLQTERSTRLTDIERSRLQLEKAERNYTRAKELFANKLISQELHDDSKTEFELAKNTLERSEKDLRQLEVNLTKTKILAPFDCTVLTRPVSIGQAVSGSGGFNSGTEVLTIANLNAMVINAHINQADITRVSIGLDVEVRIESVPGLKLVGTVERMAPQTTIKNGIKGYAVRITLKKLDPRVLPGMTANLTIPVRSAANAVAVPLPAVFTEMGERFVYVKNGEKFERRTVESGVADYDYAEILSGLKPGEVVALETPAGETPNKGIHKLASERPGISSPGKSGSPPKSNKAGASNSGEKTAKK